MEGLNQNQLKKLKAANKIYDRIEIIIKKADISARELGRLLGLSEAGLNRIKKRGTIPKADLLVKLVYIVSPKLFKGKRISWNWLMVEEGPMFEKE